MADDRSDALSRREDSRKEYLRRRVEKKIELLEEDIQYAKIVEEEDTSNLELVLDAVKDPSGAAGTETLDFEVAQLRRTGQRGSLKRYRSLSGDRHHMDSPATPKDLPINGHEDAIIKMIREHQVSVIVAETGSGKTTQIPQMLYRSGFLSVQSKLVCTQPRRVAAVSVAHRVSEELLQGSLRNLRDGIVGYSVRFDDQTAPQTIIKFVTDGLLLREFVSAPDLAEYGCVMIDEAHERTASTDILLGLLKDLCRFRADLRLIISSATMNATKFSQFYDGAPVYCVPGRLFPVERRFLSTPQQDYVYAAVQCCLDICRQGRDGAEQNDVLVFLTGQEEVDMAVRVVREKAEQAGLDLLVFPLYSALPASQQQAIFRPTPYGCTKVILATNIAETSITVDGIVHVIDTGMVKQLAFNPRTGVESLVVTATSQASSEQRAGRAGRTRPGVCYRLYTEEYWRSEMPKDGVPEMQRSNLASICLFMKALGIDDIVEFDFVDPPPPDLLSRSLADLYRLGALEAVHGELTKVGLQMAELPVDPALARVLISSVGLGCVEECVRIAALISLEMTLFYGSPARPQGGKGTEPRRPQEQFGSSGGDHFMLLAVFNGWLEAGKSDKWCAACSINPAAVQQADNIRRQLMAIIERVFPDVEDVLPAPPPKGPSSSDTAAKIRQAFVSGYSNNVAVLDRSGMSYTVAGGRTAHIHPSSCLASGRPPRRLLFHDILSTSKDFMRTVMVLEETG